MKNTINPLDELLPVISAAVAEWKVNNAPEKIKDRVHMQLDKASMDVASLISKIVVSKDIDSYVKALNLIEPTHYAPYK